MTSKEYTFSMGYQRLYLGSAVAKFLGMKNGTKLNLFVDDDGLITCIITDDYANGVCYLYGKNSAHIYNKTIFKNGLVKMDGKYKHQVYNDGEYKGFKLIKCE